MYDYIWYCTLHVCVYNVRMTIYGIVLQMEVTQSSVMPIMRGVSCCLGNQQLTYSEGEECIGLSLRKKTAALALLHNILT